MAPPLALTYEIQDNLGVPATHVLYLTGATSLTLANLQTFANDYTPLIDAIIDGEIIGIHMKVPLTISGAKGAPVSPGNAVEETGLFNFEQSGSNYKNGVDVPSFAASKIVNGKIDLSDTDVASWKAFILATTVGLTVVSKFANALVALLDSVITFRKKRKLENKRSYEVP